MIIDGVKVEADTVIFDVEELKKYVQYVKEHSESWFGELRKIRLTLCADGKVDIQYKFGEPFDRIRRITGYLTGDLNTWNDAKRAEESERVKHNYD